MHFSFLNIWGFNELFGFHIFGFDFNPNQDTGYNHCLLGVQYISDYKKPLLEIDILFIPFRFKLKKKDETKK